MANLYDKNILVA